MMEKAMAPHSSTLAWKIPWMEETGRLQSMGSRRVRHDWATSLSLFTFMHGEGNGNPLQCSCLENPRDGGVWWAAVYGVAQSRTWLKQLSSSSSIAGWKSWGFNTLAIWCEELTHWKKPWCWERLKAGVEGDDRGWDGWMASPTQWTWVWASSRSWWWTGKPGLLQSMGLQKAGHNWMTELNGNEEHNIQYHGFG